MSGLAEEQVQYLLGSHLNSVLLHILGYGIHTCIFFVALYYIGAQLSTISVGS